MTERGGLSLHHSPDILGSGSLALIWMPLPDVKNRQRFLGPMESETCHVGNLQKMFPNDVSSHLYNSWSLMYVNIYICICIYIYISADPCLALAQAGRRPGSPQVCGFGLLGPRPARSTRTRNPASGHVAIIHLDGFKTAAKHGPPGHATPVGL